ncbi:MAG TPA: flagellar motor switch protein FliN [bacterium]|nr:flagellar motor switch protein FliN [bacterium]
MTDVIPDDSSPVESQPPVVNNLPPPGGLPAPTVETGQTNIELLMDVTLQVAVELGQTRMTVREVLDLQKGAVIELDHIAGDAVDVFVNNRMIARGEVVVVDDKFGVRITEMIVPHDSSKRA